MFRHEKFRREYSHISKGFFAVSTKIYISKCHTVRPRCTFTHVICIPDSNRATLRHIGKIAYCCSVPRLTRFTTSDCAGPCSQHRKMQSRLHKCTPQPDIHPCYSGLQVQGTATSPVSIAMVI